ncbi:hypothetical protein GGTG_01419 [Gaeumannomyces tritici R3-111a-1]|uniref:Uncharacterized protein n=1 Tax=Gaeumannomyces tritici (strain R3-111a-1) TaxID=644352 RepID=J3NJI7_GAET3|nr:hypothetical protein GGTG_01419 [Gaeumannomyces tritici R3-111a-1]EJT81439.1 hypothetical protein GGTG_01419 [Gaeumannomyces tritici R3-111a-1]
MAEHSEAHKTTDKHAFWAEKQGRAQETAHVEQLAPEPQRQQGSRAAKWWPPPRRPAVQQIDPQLQVRRQQTQQPPG